MASEIYNQEVIFRSDLTTKVVPIALKRCLIPIWIPLLITERKARTALLHLYLSTGVEDSTPITLTVPLFVGLSSDVTDYTCEALFQDGRDEKESVNNIKKNSNVRTFSVDVSHNPPSTYTVKDLNSDEFDIEPSRPLSQISQTRSVASGDTTFFIQEGLRQLCLSATNTSNGLIQHKSLVFLKDTETGFKSLHFALGSEWTFPFQLRPLCDYNLLVIRGYETKKYLFFINAVAVCSFKSHMTQNEVYLLYGKACIHSLSPGPRPSYDFYPVTHLYRSKPILYFLDIFNNSGGIMEKYIKNLGGDPASTLNRRLHGLFFSSSADPLTGQPPAVSYYGDQRIHIHIGFMIDQSRNLYFADFYCHYVNHRVTLVITLKGSEADAFCRQRLRALDPAYNEFLYRRPHEHYAMVNTKVTVEVFYTEDINIFRLLRLNLAYLTSVQQSSNAELKTVIGLPKRIDCKICNIKKPL
eukprot:XP_011422619.1 PREDICTED: uncharacterized protein LOC105325001 [Crassostrea gigas]